MSYFAYSTSFLNEKNMPIHSEKDTNSGTLNCLGHGFN